MNSFIFYFYFIGTECDLKHQMCKRKDSKLNVFTMLPWLQISIPTKGSVSAVQLLESNNGKYTG